MTRRIRPLLLLDLSIIVFLSSCAPSPSGLILCSITLDTGAPRSLSSIIEPISTYDIYYKTICKGSGDCYGGMTESDDYKKLDGNGILVSQGLCGKYWWSSEKMVSNP